MSAEGVVAVAVMNRTAALQLITMAAQARYMVMAQHRLQAHRLLHRGKVHPAFTRAGRHWLSPADAEAILVRQRSEEHTSELQSLAYLVCRLLLEKKKKRKLNNYISARDMYS